MHLPISLLCRCRRGGRVLVLGLLALVAVGGDPVLAAPSDQPELRQVRLRLKWLHQFQFAGFYAAVEKGYFREQGIAVDIIEGRPDRDPVADVVAGEAEFGIGNSGLVIARAQGLPVVAVAVIFQHSPFVLLARKESGLYSVHDLPGRTLALEAHADELLAYLKLERVPLDRLKIVPHGGDALALERREVDALTAYTTSEPYDLIKAGVPFQIFNPRASGIDFYGDTLFTTRDLAARDPRLVEAFRAASVKGWVYALDHIEEMVDLIRARYAPRLDRDRLLFEAEEIRRLMIADMVEVGYMYPGRWRHIADGFAAAGLVPAGLSLDGFLFQPDARPDLRWLYGSLALAVVVIAVAVTVVARFHGLNRNLRREIADRRRLEDELRRLATTDPLTGISNRRRLREMLEREFLRWRRFGHRMAVLVADLDHFKRINDRFGHATGDLALQAFAAACSAQLRDVDTLGRMGGEEFAVVLPETDAEGAACAAERIRQAVEALTLSHGTGEPVTLTVSIGLAVVEDADHSVDALYARADAALYEAKRQGRNQVAPRGPGGGEAFSPA